MFQHLSIWSLEREAQKGVFKELLEKFLELKWHIFRHITVKSPNKNPESFLVEKIGCPQRKKNQTGVRMSQTWGIKKKQWSNNLKFRTILYLAKLAFKVEHKNRNRSGTTSLPLKINPKEGQMINTSRKERIRKQKSSLHIAGLNMLRITINVKRLNLHIKKTMLPIRHDLKQSDRSKRM